MSYEVKRRQFLGLMGGSAALALVPRIASAAGVNIDIGTMATGSTWYQYGVQLSQFMQQNLPDGSAVTARPYAAADGNLRLIEANDRIQAGFTFSLNLSWAQKKMTDISDATAENVRLIAGALDKYFVGMMALSSIGVETISEALDAKRGLRISTLQAGSLGDISTGLLLRAHGIDEKTLESWGGSVTRVGMQAASENMVTGRSDVWINPISAGHPRASELAFGNDMRFLTLAEGPMAKMEEFGFQPLELPAGAFNGQDKAEVLPGTSTTLIVNKDLDEEVAYQITKAIIDNLDQIKSENKSLSGLDLARAANPAFAGGTPLHPGAEKAYKEAGVI